MSQNIYDDPHFFAGYATLDRSVKGLDGAPEWPALQAMLPPLHDKRILDLGCGYGWFCRYARDNHAASVVGLDISEKMLTQARNMTTGEGISYQREDLDTLTLTADSFELVYSSLALHYLQDIERLLVTIYQALTPGGMLVFSAEHPIYTAPLTQGWIKDKTGQLSWPVNHYQQEGERISNWFAEGVKKQHRKLATWINALIGAGFEIVCVDEWGPSAEQIAANPALDEEKERPMVFLLSARKPA
ncbi:class I SAM-dependent methyltransferase [Citrobacter freundii]|uniref:class I SAM-dependent methyltransferase n=1 Tax=Citrobacter sp. wls711 TaxID=2576425 RepID=UPI000BBD1153|nr:MULTISPECIES: class I SAM-dependent methyltransferase [Citrobacter]HEE0104142.1 class I SAM-dependent methyltransferase [Citrobacter gillenii]ATF48933.1 SAM-dependent methyltransferase [Citrobacter werkmanii]EJB8470458.1 class I SAM-dependent methyltransferase [Citrobacter freundii]EJB8560674.1 class I SAM-dependent methyltransferase [Citrobacter freundii]MBA8034527.1 class I SAM-dependent methyltransferase [Citrobacter freundii]